MNIKTFGALVATALVGTALLAAPAAHAASVADATVESSGVVIAQEQSASLQAKPSAPRAITVTTAPGTAVTVSAAGTPSRTKVTNTEGHATFTRLKAGTAHTVTAGDTSVTVVPVTLVGKTSDLTVSSTDQAGTVQLTWRHKATKSRGGKSIGYTVTATPVADEEATTNPTAAITFEVRTTSATLTGLDPTALYDFTVTPHNALGAGEPSVARMSRSLEDMTEGSRQVPQDDAQHRGEAQPKRTPEQAAIPATNPAAAPNPAPQPRTRTIWVCPDGYSENGSSCTQTRAYTYSPQQETQAYTYSPQQETQPYTYRTETRTESCAGPDCPGSQYVNFGTDWTGGSCPNGGTLHGGQCLGWTGSSKQVSYQVKNAPPAGWSDSGSQYVRTVQVKDPAPAGWSDNGSQYVRTVQVKDAAPAGWSDNGSEWVLTASKIEKVVPA